MRQIQISGSDLHVSRFSFGTASLHHLSGTAEQARHLRAAHDAGFTHFDTAPLYGFGAAERALGEAFAGQNDVSIATKVGLYPPGGDAQSRLQMLARKVGGKLSPSLSQPVSDWTVARAQTSFEGSLERLKRERVDILFLHEPAAEHIDNDAWLTWLEAEIARGRIGQIGVAGPAPTVAPFIAAQSGLAAVVQTQDSLAGREADVLLAAQRPLQFTYGYQSAPDAAVTDRAALLSEMLARNTTGSILVSTRKPERLRAFAEASEADSAAHTAPPDAPC